MFLSLFSQMLMQLKNLALEAETELEKQDEGLDVLTTSTDQATMHIRQTHLPHEKAAVTNSLTTQCRNAPSCYCLTTNVFCQKVVVLYLYI